MFELVKLVILFFVLFDPLASLMVFFVSTKGMSHKARDRTAFYAILIAGALSFGALLLGDLLLELFNTNIDNFRIAGGLILVILGIRMALGYAIVPDMVGKRYYAIASVIATPLLTGPAVLTAIIVTKNDFGMLATGLAVLIVLLVTLLIFYNAKFVHDKIGLNATQVISTFLGLITIAWGVDFLRVALGF